MFEVIDIKNINKDKESPPRVFFCKNNHPWNSKDSANKCCNGYRRVFRFCPLCSDDLTSANYTDLGVYVWVKDGAAKTALDFVGQEA